MEEICLEHFSQFPCLFRAYAWQAGAEDLLVRMDGRPTRLRRADPLHNPSYNTELVCRRHDTYQIWVVNGFPGIVVANHDFQ